MLFRFVPAAIVAAAFFASEAIAQGRPPANLPPPGFAGQQWVDNRGCLYIRAGHGGQVNWVARIDASRRPICGQTPTMQTMSEARAALDAPVAAQPIAPRARSGIAPSQYTPPPVTYGAPTPLARPARAKATAAATPQPRMVRAAPSPAPAPTVFNSAAQGESQSAAAPARHYPQPAISASRVTGCPDFAPYGQFYPLHRGGTTLLCASAPHRISGLSPAEVEAHVARAGKRHVVHGHTAESLDAPPAGYKKAWRDDRLNPNRAKGTAEGKAQMARVWTNDVPQRAQPGAHRQTGHKAGHHHAMAHAGLFVQVGSFGVPSNAARAADRLRAMGMPVQIGHGRVKGKALQIVSAGPFHDQRQADAALSAARSAGFSDAILRR